MININNRFWREIRCYECRKLLGYEYIYSGRLVIKCPKCKTENIIKYRTPKSLLEKLIKADNDEYNKNITNLNSKGGDK